jgi:hypothetical protein
MGKRAIALGDRCASRVAMNGQAAVVSVIILGEIEHLSARRRLSVDLALAFVRHSDKNRNPRLAFMRRTYFESKVFDSPRLP